MVGWRIGVVAIAVAAAPVSAGADAAKVHNPWAAVSVPLPGRPASIGGYSAGCIRGAVALPDSGKGFQLARPRRKRNFGHPVLISFIEDLGAALAKRKTRLLVGDLGQPGGGPAPSGHSSHQTGLDVDLWYWAPRRALSAKRREKLSAPTMVSTRRKRTTRRFTRRIRRKLELAATDERVARIFVNPLVKRALCRALPPGRRGWLHKLRPWWGHDHHFHVRLACPAGSPECQAQAPIADGDGCDELDWWLDEKAQAERKKQHKGYRHRVRSLPELPAACSALLAKKD